MDRKADLAVVNQRSADVTVLLGNGIGGFAQQSLPLTVGSNPTSVAVEDFNLDGSPDLAVSNSGSNNVTILIGDGSGGFTETASSPVVAGGDPYSVATGDFNLDGKPDLAVANNSSFNVTIQLNTCMSAFDVCLKDDSKDASLQFNSRTGDYRFNDCRKGITLIGTGNVTTKACKITLQDNGLTPKRPDRSVLVQANRCTNSARASILIFSTGSSFSITDSNITNNSCACR